MQVVMVTDSYNPYAGLCGHGYMRDSCARCKAYRPKYSPRLPKIKCAKCQDTGKLLVPAPVDADDPWSLVEYPDCDCQAAGAA